MKYKVTLENIFIFLLKILMVIGVYFFSKWIFQKNSISQVDHFENLELTEGQFFHSSFISSSQGEIPFCVYLPPNWKSDDTTTFPLLIYLYGQYGDENAFAHDISAQQINDWIHHKEIPPFIIFTFLGNPIKKNIQWFSEKNELLLTSEAPGELRSFCRKTFRAGTENRSISLEGHSRGASGVLYYAFNHSNQFSSFIANAYVSDYTLENLKESIKKNKAQILKNEIKLRMEIGTEDYFEKKYHRQGSELLHQFLKEEKIPHEFNILNNVDHWYPEIWNYPLSNPSIKNGLSHLKYHSNQG